jgi:glycogen(starch) synthase
MLEVQRYAEVAAEIAKTFEFDVIHSHDWMTYPAGIAAMEASKKPLVIHVHASEYDRSGENVNKAIYALELEGMQKANRVITVSKFTKVLVAEKYKIAGDKIHVVHNGVATTKLRKVVYKSPLKDSAIVTFVGRITQQKGPLFFVEAARKVLTSLPGTRFIVVLFNLFDQPDN